MVFPTQARTPLFSVHGAGPERSGDRLERGLQIEAEQTRLLYSQSSTNLIVTILNSSILVAVLRPVTSTPVLWAWLAAMVAVTAGRAALVLMYHQAAPVPRQHRPWRLAFIIGASCAGLVWGGASIFLFPQNSQAHQIFLAFVLGGMITGAVAVLSWVQGAFLAFLLPAALPLVIRFCVHGGEIFVAMGTLSIVFIAAVLTTSRRLHTSVTRSLALGFENTALVHDLSLSERATAAMNAALRDEVAERRRAEDELRAARDQLEARVHARTAELVRTNATLEGEIAARKTAERAVQRERDLLEITLASIGDAVIATDPNAILTFMNPVAETLTGWRASEAVGRHIDEVLRIFDERSRQPVESPVDRVLREQVVVALTNHSVLLSRNGREVPIADSGSPIRGKDGQLYGAVVVFRDVTDRQRAEAALLAAKEVAEAADRAKSEFLATMSHELRTPLTTVIGYTDLLVEHAFGRLTHQQRGVVERVNASAHQVHELIAAMLDLSRLEAGRLPVNVQEVRIAELLAQVREDTRELQERSGLRFVWNADGDIAPVQTDPGKLKVVVRNLIGNASKFTEAGQVAITAASCRDGVEIRISDTGIGIPRDALSSIFEPFRQVDAAVGYSRGGTGLGLHIVKRLLELLGGEVSVESEEGHGSTFRVWVPARAACALHAPD